MELNKSVKWKEISAVLNLLEKRGYIDKVNNLTDKAKVLLQEYQSIEDIKSQPITTFSQWVQNLHVKLQDELLTLTGKKQKVLPSGKSLIPNAVNLEKKLKSVITKHRIKDVSLIEKLLIQYIQKCNAKRWGQFTQAMEYYIEKNEVSAMATDLDTFDEKETITELKSAGDTFI